MRRRLSVTMAMIMVLNLAAFMALLPETPVALAATTSLLSENFESYASSSALQTSGGWAHTVAISNITLGTNSTKYAIVNSGSSNAYGSKTFAPIPLNSSGGASPGNNAKLIAEFRVARGSWNGGNGSWATFTDSAITTNNTTNTGALTVGSRMQGASPWDTAIYRYSTNLTSVPSGTAVLSGTNDSSKNGTWAKVRFEVTITNGSGEFLASPVVNAYVDDSGTPSVLEESILNASNKINTIRLSSSSSSGLMWVDDINVSLQTDGTPTPAPITTLLSDNFNGYANIAAMQSAGWTITGSPVLATTEAPAYSQYFTTVASSSGTRTFAPVALTAAGGSSPGNNAKLVVYFDAYTSGGSGSSQDFWWVDDSATGNVAVSAGRRAGGGDYIRYSNNIPSTFTGLTISNGLSRFTAMKFVIKITDANGAFLSGGPKVDVYCGNMSTPISGGTDVAMIDTATTRVNRFYIGGAYSSHEVDNLSITLETSGGGATPTPTPTLTPTPPPSSTNMTISNVRKVSTFNCISIYADYANQTGTPYCNIKYRVTGSGTWMDGQSLWVDTANQEVRGSLVYLTPGTSYDIQLTYGDSMGYGTHTSTQSTWNETFPEGTVTTITNQSTTLNITQSGTANAYRVYQGPSPSTLGVVDVNRNAANAITVNASYVIIRGLDIKDATANAILIDPSCHDVIIEDCTISNWGPTGVGRDENGVYFDWAEASAIYSGFTDPDTYELGSERLIIQNNSIGPAAGCAGGWEFGHPTGPQGISICQSRGNNVIRYNEVWGNESHWYNDCIGGALNHDSGNMNRDSDIYGNVCNYSMDDTLELEGWNINVRIWNNFTENCWRGIATASGDIKGPLYVFRNIFGSNGDNVGTATKLLGQGPIFFYHNMFGTPDSYLATGILPTVRDGSIQNITTRNNIFYINPSHEGGPFSKDWRYYQGSCVDDIDYDHFIYDPRGDTGFDQTDETHGIFSAPTLSLNGDFNWYHTTGSNGYNAAYPLPGFNNQYDGAGPDTGACESGVYTFAAGIQ